MSGDKIRVLIVDDSFVFREVIAMGIASEADIEVVGKAIDPFDARDKILKLHPDVMTCDVEMPRMNGIEFIKRLLPQYSIPVIVISSISNAVFDAIEAGAVDFVTKPNVESKQSVNIFISDIINKIHIAAKAKIVRVDNNKGEVVTQNNLNMNKIIAIGASTGGTEAIYSVLKALPSDMPGIVIVQHIPPVFSRMFAERLNNQTNLNVKEAQGGEYVEKGQVLIAPGDKHMIIKKIGDRYKVEVFSGEKVNGHCPSADVLFKSVAEVAKANAIGIILTGMGYDGAKGLLAMHRRGAKTIGQNKETSVVYGMPKVAYELGAVDKQASLYNIPQVLVNLLKRQSVMESM